MAGEPTHRQFVTVPVTGLWRSPEALRPVDQPMTLDQPDHRGWLDAMDAHDVEAPEGRAGLLNVIDSQLTFGEPVDVHEVRDGWTRVTAPWQPSRHDPDGYPGWIPSAHLSDDQPTALTELRTNGLAEIDPESFVAQARSHLDLPYLWGGVSADGLDCSGLVHYSARTFGWKIPRDADDQYAAAVDVPLDDVRTGDLYFFAHPGKTIHHVGIVTEPGSMIHAPESGVGIVEEELTEARRKTLVHAGRILR